MGSEGRNLATCRTEDQGFELSYNFIIDSPGIGQEWDGRKVHSAFLHALEYSVYGTEYSEPEASASVFTIRNAEGGPVSRCDIAVVYYDSPRSLCYLRRKEDGGYGFAERRLKHIVDDAVERIIEDDSNNWALIRDNYLRLKNSGREEDIPYLLFVDAVDEAYSKLFGDSDERPKTFRRVFARSEFL